MRAPVALERAGRRLDGWRGHASQLAVLAAALLGAILAIVLGLGSSYDGTVAEIDRHMETYEAVNDLLVSIVDAEALERAFLLTGEDAYVGEFGRARDDARRAVARLMALTEVDASQQARLANVRERVDDRMKELQGEIEAKQDGRPVAQTWLLRGASASPIRLLLRDVVRDQQQRLEEARVDAAGTRRVLRILLLFAAVPLVLVVVAQWALHARWRAAEAALRASEESFRRFFENAAVGLAQATPDGAVLRVNPAFAELAGEREEDLAGRPLAELVDPGGSSPLSEALARLVRSSQSLDTEVLIRRRDAGVVWVRLTAAVDPGAEGRADRLLIVAQDVSARRALEEQLRASTARLQAILDHSPSVIWIKDRDGRYLLANRQLESLFGAPPGGVVGRTDHELVPAELADAYRASDLAVLERGAPVATEEEVRLGAVARTFLSVKFPLPDPRGRTRAVGAVSTDITARKAAEREAEEEARLRELFLGVVGHDLRNPLGAIVLSLDRAARDPSISERTRATLAGARAAARRMNQMIADLLDFTRGRLGGGLPLERLEADLADVVRDTVAEVRAAHPDHDIRLELHGDGRGRWDVARIAQVVVNLVSNAVQHGEPGEPVEVSLRGEDVVCLTVHNGGPPIPEEARPRLFEPFRIVDVGRAREGLGLGLWIARQVVVGHGGTIEVRSAEGLGTTFVVTLPRGLGAPSPPA